MKIAVKEVLGLDKSPIRIPSVSDGEVEKDEKGNMILHPATTRDIIDLIIFNIPAQIFTRQDSIHAHRLYNQAHEAVDGVMEIKDAEYDWLHKKLQNDEIGARMFKANLVLIEEALKSEKG